MRLYLDSFDMQAWDRLLPTGLFYGITTNPLLAQRAGLSYPDIDWRNVIGKAEAFPISELHIQLPDTGDSALEFLDRLDRVKSESQLNLVIKVPLDQAGITLVPQIQSAGFNVLMTACYHAKQMFVSQALGASYIAPYYGRMIEAGIDARDHLRQMRMISQSAEQPCEILVASLRSVDHMLELASDGHDMFTIAPKIADDLLFDSLSDAAITEFSKAARNR